MLVLQVKRLGVDIKNMKSEHLWKIDLLKLMLHIQENFQQINICLNYEFVI